MLLYASSYFVQFAVTASLGVVFGYLADLQERYDLSNAELGVIAASGFAAALFTQLLLAPFVDRGHAAAVAWLGVSASALGSLGFVFAEQAWTLSASRGLSGIGFGLFSIVARKALIGTDMKGGAVKVGRLFSCGVAGFISGPAIGASFGTISFEAPFVLIGSVVVLTGPVAATLIGRATIATTHVDYSQIGDLLRRPRVQAALGGEIALWGFVGLFDSTVDRYLTDVGMSSLQIALGLLVIGVPLLILPPIAGALAERIGASVVFRPSYLALLPAVWVYGYVGGLATFLVIGVLEGVIESYAAMSAQVLVLEATGVERVATGTALLEAVGLLFALIGALLGPVAYGALGQQRLFLLWALAMAVPVAVAWMRLHCAKRF